MGRRSWTWKLEDVSKRGTLPRREISSGKFAQNVVKSNRKAIRTASAAGSQPPSPTSDRFLDTRPKVDSVRPLEEWKHLHARGARRLRPGEESDTSWDSFHGSPTAHGGGPQFQRQRPRPGHDDNDDEEGDSSWHGVRGDMMDDTLDRAGRDRVDRKGEARSHRRVADGNAGSVTDDDAEGSQDEVHGAVQGKSGRHAAERSASRQPRSRSPASPGRSGMRSKSPASPNRGFYTDDSDSVPLPGSAPSGRGAPSQGAKNVSGEPDSGSHSSRSRARSPARSPSRHRPGDDPRPGRRPHDDSQGQAQGPFDSWLYLVLPNPEHQEAGSRSPRTAGRSASPPAGGNGKSARGRDVPEDTPGLPGSSQSAYEPSPSPRVDRSGQPDAKSADRSDRRRRRGSSSSDGDSPDANRANRGDRRKRRGASSSDGDSPDVNRANREDRGKRRGSLSKQDGQPGLNSSVQSPDQFGGDSPGGSGQKLIRERRAPGMRPKVGRRVPGYDDDSGRALSPDEGASSSQEPPPRGYRAPGDVFPFLRRDYDEHPSRRQNADSDQELPGTSGYQFQRRGDDDRPQPIGSPPVADFSSDARGAVRRTQSAQPGPRPDGNRWFPAADDLSSVVRQGRHVPGADPSRPHSSGDPGPQDAHGFLRRARPGYPGGSPERSSGDLGPQGAHGFSRRARPGYPGGSPECDEELPASSSWHTVKRAQSAQPGHPPRQTPGGDDSRRGPGGDDSRRPLVSNSPPSASGLDSLRRDQQGIGAGERGTPSSSGHDFSGAPHAQGSAVAPSNRGPPGSYDSEADEQEHSQSHHGPSDHDAAIRPAKRGQVRPGEMSDRPGGADWDGSEKDAKHAKGGKSGQSAKSGQGGSHDGQVPDRHVRPYGDSDYEEDEDIPPGSGFDHLKHGKGKREEKGKRTTRHEREDDQDVFKTSISEHHGKGKGNWRDIGDEGSHGPEGQRSNPKFFKSGQRKGPHSTVDDENRYGKSGKGPHFGDPHTQSRGESDSENDEDIVTGSGFRYGKGKARWKGEVDERHDDDFEQITTEPSDNTFVKYGKGKKGFVSDESPASPSSPNSHKHKHKQSKGKKDLRGDDGSQKGSGFHNTDISKHDYLKRRRGPADTTNPYNSQDTLHEYMREGKDNGPRSAVDDSGFCSAEYPQHERGRHGCGKGKDPHSKVDESDSYNSDFPQQERDRRGGCKGKGPHSKMDESSSYPSDFPQYGRDSAGCGKGKGPHSKMDESGSYNSDFLPQERDRHGGCKGKRPHSKMDDSGSYSSEFPQYGRDSPGCGKGKGPHPEMDESGFYKSELPQQERDRHGCGKGKGPHSKMDESGSNRSDFPQYGRDSPGCGKGKGPHSKMDESGSYTSEFPQQERDRHGGCKGKGPHSKMDDSGSCSSEFPQYGRDSPGCGKGKGPHSKMDESGSYNSDFPQQERDRHGYGKGKGPHSKMDESESYTSEFPQYGRDSPGCGKGKGPHSKMDESHSYNSDFPQQERDRYGCGKGKGPQSKMDVSGSYTSEFPQYGCDSPGCGKGKGPHSKMDGSSFYNSDFPQQESNVHQPGLHNSDYPQHDQMRRGKGKRPNFLTDEPDVYKLQNLQHDSGRRDKGKGPHSATGEEIHSGFYSPNSSKHDFLKRGKGRPSDSEFDLSEPGKSPSHRAEHGEQRPYDTDYSRNDFMKRGKGKSPSSSVEQNDAGPYDTDYWKHEFLKRDKGNGPSSSAEQNDGPYDPNSWKQELLQRGKGKSPSSGAEPKEDPDDPDHWKYEFLKRGKGKSPSSNAEPNTDLDDPDYWKHEFLKRSKGKSPTSSAQQNDGADDPDYWKHEFLKRGKGKSPSSSAEPNADPDDPDHWKHEFLKRSKGKSPTSSAQQNDGPDDPDYWKHEFLKRGKGKSPSSSAEQSDGTYDTDYWKHEFLKRGKGKSPRSSAEPNDGPYDPDYWKHEFLKRGKGKDQHATAGEENQKGSGAHQALSSRTIWVYDGRGKGKGGSAVADEISLASGFDADYSGHSFLKRSKGKDPHTIGEEDRSKGPDASNSDYSKHDFLKRGKGKDSSSTSEDRRQGLDDPNPDYMNHAFRERGKGKDSSSTLEDEVATGSGFDNSDYSKHEFLKRGQGKDFHSAEQERSTASGLNSSDIAKHDFLKRGMGKDEKPPGFHRLGSDFDNFDDSKHQFLKPGHKSPHHRNEDSAGDSGLYDSDYLKHDFLKRGKGKDGHSKPESDSREAFHDSDYSKQDFLKRGSGGRHASAKEEEDFAGSGSYNSEYSKHDFLKRGKGKYPDNDDVEASLQGSQSHSSKQVAHDYLKYGQGRSPTSASAEEMLQGSTDVPRSAGKHNPQLGSSADLKRTFLKHGSHDQSRKAGDAKHEEEFEYDLEPGPDFQSHQTFPFLKRNSGMGVRTKPGASSPDLKVVTQKGSYAARRSTDESPASSGFKEPNFQPSATASSSSALQSNSSKDALNDTLPRGAMPRNNGNEKLATLPAKSPLSANNSTQRRTPHAQDAHQQGNSGIPSSYSARRALDEGMGPSLASHRVVPEQSKAPGRKPDAKVDPAYQSATRARGRSPALDDDIPGASSYTARRAADAHASLPDAGTPSLGGPNRSAPVVVSKSTANAGGETSWTGKRTDDASAGHGVPERQGRETPPKDKLTSKGGSYAERRAIDDDMYPRDARSTKQRGRSPSFDDGDPRETSRGSARARAASPDDAGSPNHSSRQPRGAKSLPVDALRDAQGGSPRGDSYLARRARDELHQHTDDTTNDDLHLNDGSTAKARRNETSATGKVPGSSTKSSSSYAARRAADDGDQPQTPSQQKKIGQDTAVGQRMATKVPSSYAARRSLDEGGQAPPGMAPDGLGQHAGDETRKDQTVSTSSSAAKGSASNTRGDTTERHGPEASLDGAPAAAGSGTQAPSSGSGPPAANSYAARRALDSDAPPPARHTHNKVVSKGSPKLSKSSSNRQFKAMQGSGNPDEAGEGSQMTSPKTKKRGDADPLSYAARRRAERNDDLPSPAGTGIAPLAYSSRRARDEGAMSAALGPSQSDGSGGTQDALNQTLQKGRRLPGSTTNAVDGASSYAARRALDDNRRRTGARSDADEPLPSPADVEGADPKPAKSKATRAGQASVQIERSHSLGPRGDRARMASTPSSPARLGVRSPGGGSLTPQSTPCTPAGADERAIGGTLFSGTGGISRDDSLNWVPPALKSPQDKRATGGMLFSSAGFGKDDVLNAVPPTLKSPRDDRAIGGTLYAGTGGLSRDSSLNWVPPTLTSSRSQRGVGGTMFGGTGFSNDAAVLNAVPPTLKKSPREDRAIGGALYGGTGFGKDAAVLNAMPPSLKAPRDQRETGGALYAGTGGLSRDDLLNWVPPVKSTPVDKRGIGGTLYSGTGGLGRENTLNWVPPSSGSPRNERVIGGMLYSGTGFGEDNTSNWVPPNREPKKHMAGYPERSLRTTPCWSPGGSDDAPEANVLRGRSVERGGSPIRAAEDLLNSLGQGGDQQRSSSAPPGPKR